MPNELINKENKLFLDVCNKKWKITDAYEGTYFHDDDQFIFTCDPIGHSISKIFHYDNSTGITSKIKFTTKKYSPNWFTTQPDRNKGFDELYIHCLYKVGSEKLELIFRFDYTNPIKPTFEYYSGHALNQTSHGRGGGSTT